ncbi:MAG: hypothetical protein IPK26_28040 [Planctomycetes bacterium]|nr:hypothetical protein [Planctomycetota bacterium]
MRIHPLLLLLTLLPAVRAQIFPPPPVPAGNPQTPAKILLGKALFWDEQLSSTRTVACGTCHIFSAGGSDPRVNWGTHPGPDQLFGTDDDIAGSFGVPRTDAQGHQIPDPLFGLRPQATGRRAPTVINAAYQRELFLDGRASGAFRDPITNAVVLPTDAALESQIAGPPVNDVEMSHMGRTWTDIAADIASQRPLALADQIPAALQAFVGTATYAQLFQQVYGSPGVTPTRIIFAIAAYERTLIADQSPLDRHFAGQGTLGAAEQRGLGFFQGLCGPCHTDTFPAVLTTGPVVDTFRNVGIRPIADDLGRFLVTNQPADRGRFKVPTLRNVALRGPWFHNGAINQLAEVIDFYARGGDFHVNQDPLVFNIIGQVSPQHRTDLVAFLNSMTDPRVAAELPPFDRPRLWSESNRVPTTFGAGTAGTGSRVPMAALSMPPFLGNTRFSIGVEETAPNALHFAVWDAAATPAPTILFGQNVYLARTPSLTFTAPPGLTDAQGYSSAMLPIPLQPSLRGLQFFGQWLILDAAGPFGMTVSDAFGLRVF